MTESVTSYAIHADAATGDAVRGTVTRTEAPRQVRLPSESTSGRTPCLQAPSERQSERDGECGTDPQGWTSSRASREGLDDWAWPSGASPRAQDTERPA